MIPTSWTGFPERSFRINGEVRLTDEQAVMVVDIAKS
jgi:hypothetical protein